MRRVFAVVALTAGVLVTCPMTAANALSCSGYPTHGEFVAASAKEAEHLFTGRVTRRRDVTPPHDARTSWAYDVDVVESLKGGSRGRVTVLAPSDADVAGIAGYNGHGLRLVTGELTFFATYDGFRARILCGTLTTQDDVAGRTEEVRRALALLPAPPADSASALPVVVGVVAAGAALAVLVARFVIRSRRPAAA